MSRVQLALNVADLDAGDRLLLQALRHRAGQGPPRLRQLRRSPSRRSSSCSSRARAPRHAEPPRRRGRVDRRGRRGHQARLTRRGPGHRDRGRGLVLLRRAGQGVGRRPRRRAVGDLHRARRRRDARRASCAADDRRRRRGLLRAIDGRVRRSAAADGAPAPRSTAPLAARRSAPPSCSPPSSARGSWPQRLSPSDVGLQLLENSVATGAALVALILAFGPVSGAHFNPVVTLADRCFGGADARREAGVYIGAQVVGACVGAMVANLMFGLPAVNVSTTVRSAATAVAVRGRRHARPAARDLRRGAPGRPSAVAPFAVGAYITAAYLFTSSTSFANPAVTIARTLSNTLRRHRAVVGARVHRHAARRRASSPSALIAVLYPIRRRPVVAHGAHRCLTSRLAGPRGPVRVRPQRRPLADGRRAARAPRRRPGRRALGRHRAGRRAQPGGGRGHGRGRHRPARPSAPPRSGSPTRPSRRPTSWSRWAAATSARSTPASGTWTGSSTTPPVAPVDAVRPIRDEIDRRVQRLLAELLAEPGLTPNGG